MIKAITIIGGQDKSGQPEPVQHLEIKAGEVLAVVGATGSGKSQLIADIEQYAQGDTPSQRRIIFDNMAGFEYSQHNSLRSQVAEVSQNMNFVIDMAVEDFLCMHGRSRKAANPEAIAREVIDYANQLTGEPIEPQSKLTVLSGGQSRALMIADVALISDAPVVLIDEIENAGIDRLQAMKRLAVEGKLVVLVTHDPMLALIANHRVVMKNGGIYKLHSTTANEKKVLEKLLQIDESISVLREQLRNGWEVGGFDADAGQGSSYINPGGNLAFNAK